MTEKISSLVIDTVDSQSSAGGSSTLRLICSRQIGPKMFQKIGRCVSFLVKEEW